MCRVYKATAGWYVRRCYTKGDRVGEKIPVPTGYELEGKHYPLRQSRSRSSSEAHKPSLKARKEAVARCIFCGSCLSRHNMTGICAFCAEHPERRPSIP